MTPTQLQEFRNKMKAGKAIATTKITPLPLNVQRVGAASVLIKMP